MSPIYFIIVLLVFTPSLAIPNCTEPIKNDAKRPSLCLKGINFEIRDLSPKPVKIDSTLSLHNIADINDVSKTITVDLDVQMEVNHDQLALKNSHLARYGNWYSLTQDEIKFLNLPYILIHKVKTKPKDELAEVWFNGETSSLIFNHYMRIVMYCPFDFQWFPFDSQHCDFAYGLGEYNSTNIQLKPPRIRYRDLYHLKGYPPLLMDQTWLPFYISFESMDSFDIPKAGYETGSVKNLSTARMLIHLKRNSLGLLLGGFYIPTILFSLLSLISFAINPDTVPGRLGLLITLYLIAINTYNSVNGPPSRKFSFIEIWMAGIHIPILTAILEYGLILFLKNHWRQMNNLDKFCRKMDRITFVLSLLFIILFNLTYWTISIYAD